MKSVSFFAFSMLLAAAVAMPLGLTGCKGETKDKGSKDKGSDGAVNKEPGSEKTAIPAGTGTIKGKIVLSGTKPSYEKMTAIKEFKGNDCKECKLPAGREKDFGDYKDFADADQTWIVGNDLGVANVLVRLKTPSGKYFAPSDVDKKRTTNVEFDQPCCAFYPHVLVLYPSYYNGKELVKTGQELHITNSAPFNHNTKMNGDKRKGNELDYPISSLGEKKVVLTPNDDFSVSCSIHPMMKAHFFVYDHPYAVVTKEDGTFVLNNVPVGTEVNVEFWHEEKGVFEKKNLTLAEKETKDFGSITLSK